MWLIVSAAYDDWSYYESEFITLINYLWIGFKIMNGHMMILNLC